MKSTLKTFKNYAKNMLLQVTNYELLTDFFHAFLDDFKLLSTPIPCSMLEDVDMHTCRLNLTCVI